MLFASFFFFLYLLVVFLKFHCRLLSCDFVMGIFYFRFCIFNCLFQVSLLLLFYVYVIDIFYVFLYVHHLIRPSKFYCGLIFLSLGNNFCTPFSIFQCLFAKPFNSLTFYHFVLQFSHFCWYILSIYCLIFGMLIFWDFLHIYSL